MPVTPTISGIASPADLQTALHGAQYLASDDLATAAYLALALGKPLLLEGAPGVGKTEAAKAIGAVLSRQVIRLQCYEGIDAAAALYEWNYQRQLLAIIELSRMMSPEAWMLDDSMSSLLVPVLPMCG